MRFYYSMIRKCLGNQLFRVKSVLRSTSPLNFTAKVIKRACLLILSCVSSPCEIFCGSLMPNWESKTSPNVFIYVLLSYYSKCILTADRVIIFLLLPKVRQRVYLPELCEEFRLFEHKPATVTACDANISFSCLSGTVYNATHYRYFDILLQFLSLSSTSFAIFTRSILVLPQVGHETN